MSGLLDVETLYKEGLDPDVWVGSYHPQSNSLKLEFRPLVERDAKGFTDPIKFEQLCIATELLEELGGYMYDVMFSQYSRRTDRWEPWPHIWVRHPDAQGQLQQMMQVEREKYARRMQEEPQQEILF